MNEIAFVWQQLLADIAPLWAELIGYFYFDTRLLSEPDMIIRLIIMVMLLLGSSFFSGSETALFSLSRLDLQNLRHRQHPSSETLHALLDQPRRLIISLLCGNELVNIAAAANMAGILTILYADPEKVFWVNILVMVPLLLLVGEITPKTVAVSQPVWFSTGVSRLLNTWVKIISPLRAVIRVVADRTTTLFVGDAKARENILHVDEFRSLVEDVAEEGVLDATERALISNLLEAGDTEVVEIMTPRTQTIFMNFNTPVPEAVELFKQYRHARIPVYKDQRDNLVGFLHAERILNVILDKSDLSQLHLRDLINPLVIVPLTKKVDEMFEFFQKRNVRSAVVLNEFGGVEGFITMSDVLTFIFGPLTGEVPGQELYQEHNDNRYVVPGDMRLNDFNKLTNFGIEDPRMTTIAGFVFRLLDRLPRQGEQIEWESFMFTVVAMEGHRISQLEVRKGSSHDENNDDIVMPPEKTATEVATDETPATTDESK